MNHHFLTKSLIVTVMATLGLTVVFYAVGPLELNVATVTTQKDVLFEVSDTAKVLAPPDTATVQVAVVREASSVNELQADLNKVNNAMIDAIRGVGIEDDDIKTVQFSINPRYRYNPETGEQNIDGYRATSRLEVRTTDFDLINEVIDASTQAGANEIGQVSFVVENRDEYVAKARKEAIGKAKKKAQAIASEAGISLGRLLDLQVFEGSEQPPVFLERAMMAQDAAVGGGTSVQPGQNEIQVNVQLFYALQ